MFIGVPLGVIAGRLLWRRFADQLGVVPDPAGAWIPLLLVVVGGLLVAVAVAQVPPSSQHADDRPRACASSSRQ